MNDKLASTKKILADLVAFPVVSGESNLNIVEYITDYLNSFGIETRLSFDETRAKANIFTTIGPQTDGGIMLSGHTDVVTAVGQDWTQPAFNLHEADGRLYGRGSVDMKGFLALCLAQVPDFIAANLKRPIHFGITFDEEIGSFGAKVLAEDIQSLPYKPGYCIVGEPTQMQVIAAHKGGYEITTHIKGVDGHSSDPDRGVSAIHYAVKFISHLLDVRDKLAKHSVANSAFKPAYSSINIGTLNGGISRSTIAAKCTFDWELRVMPDESGERILSQINEYAESTLLPAMRAKFPQSSVQTIVNAAYPGLAYRSESALLHIMKSLTGDDEFSVVAFGTDAGYFQQAGIETVVFGPGSIEQAHKPDEYIEISQLIEGLRFMDKLTKWAQNEQAAK